MAVKEEEGWVEDMRDGTFSYMPVTLDDPPTAAGERDKLTQ